MFKIADLLKKETKRNEGQYATLAAGGAMGIRAVENKYIHEKAKVRDFANFDELKGYDENLAYEDLDFWIRASRLYQFDFIDCILIQKRISDTSLTSSFYDKNNSRFKKINTTTYLILKKAIHLM